MKQAIPMNSLNVFLAATLLLSASVTVAKPRPKPVTPVIVVQVESEGFVDEVEALGTLRANESVDLMASVTERLTHIHFADNQRVKQGDILVEMDTTEELAELAEQQSFMAEAQRQVNRLSPLVKKGAASASALDENRRELQGAKARIAAIQSRIAQRVIKAPFDGVLGLRHLSVGALIQPGLLITTLDDDRVMKLDFSVPEVFLSTLKPGVMIAATTAAYPDRRFAGRIAVVDSRIDPVTRSIEARALIDNAEGLLKPGLLMQVVLQKNPRQALLVPEEALLANGSNHFVYVVQRQGEGATVERRKVTLGTRRYGEAEISAGLDLGEIIVIDGVQRLRQGSAVRVIGFEQQGDRLQDILQRSTQQYNAQHNAQQASGR